MKLSQFIIIIIFLSAIAGASLNTKTLMAKASLNVTRVNLFTIEKLADAYRATSDRPMTEGDGEIYGCGHCEQPMWAKEIGFQLTNCHTNFCYELIISQVNYFKVRASSLAGTPCAEPVVLEINSDKELSGLNGAPANQTCQDHS